MTSLPSKPKLYITYDQTKQQHLHKMKNSKLNPIFTDIFKNKASTMIILTKPNHSIQLNQYQPNISFQTDMTQQPNIMNKPKQLIKTNEPL
jgi:hypothetical protein